MIFADPSTATVNFNNTIANAGAGDLINATTGSVVALNASASTLSDRRDLDDQCFLGERHDLEHDRFVDGDEPQPRQQRRGVLGAQRRRLTSRLRKHPPRLSH